MKLHYSAPPKRFINGTRDAYDNERLIWEKHSLPLGNGFIGASVYGYVEGEDIIITENSFLNPEEWHVSYDNPNNYAGGLACFAKLHIDFDHKESDATDYSRNLSLDDGVYKLSYKIGSTTYEREAFASYPSRALVIRLGASESGKLTFTARGEIPYISDHLDIAGDGLSRTGEVFSENCDIRLSSTFSYYGVCVEGRWRFFIKGGKVTSTPDGIRVEGADEAYAVYVHASNYKLEERVFLEPDPKAKLAPYPMPEKKAEELLSTACAKSYDELLAEHLCDYKALFGRVALTFGEERDGDDVDTLIEEARGGEIAPHLAALLYQYGRYLLISSSRKGGLPANLQGIWSIYSSSPWTGGYWHNINVQMNYWHCGSSALTDCFIPYSDYASAYMPMARKHADGYIESTRPEALTKPGTNGWIIGTGAWPYSISGTSGHSGPGTGAFTSLLFWDHYDYTRDLEYLKRIAYPALYEMSLFFSKALEKIDERYLVKNSASPEQRHGNKYYITVGCAFDQQMVYENYKRTLEAAEALGISSDPLLDIIKEQIDLLDPVLVGKSGQVKEFREEENYGDIGEWKHRHISHLVGLYPGTVINNTTPEWLEAAKTTLELRGDRSTGWATAHRMLLRARARTPERQWDVIKSFFANNIYNNLWDTHPPFQIDGNFGYTAAVAEMLMQSHAGYIDLLPCLPKQLGDGSFRGLGARGGFFVDCDFKDRRVERAKIKSSVGGKLRIVGDWLVGTRAVKNGVAAEIVEPHYEVDTAPGDIIELLKQ